MSLPRILLLDDDETMHRAVSFQLRGFADVRAYSEPAGALAGAGADPFDAALIDVNLGDGASGVEVLAALRQVDPELACVIFTAHSDYSTAVDALGAHAFDFVAKSIGQEHEFRGKLSQAIAETRSRRAILSHAGEALRLRDELEEAAVRNELEVTNADIQRGLLGESLESFSSLLGRMELISLQLRLRAAAAPEMSDVARLSDDMLDELLDYVGRLRDYFAAPERAAQSVNEILRRAAALLEADEPEAGPVRLEPLRPDRPIRGDGRALLRVIVILLRLAAEGGAAAVSLQASLLVDPAAELDLLKLRPSVRILRTPRFRRDEPVALSIEVAGPSRAMDSNAVAALFARDGQKGARSGWAALAMLSRLEAALVAECASGGWIRYRVLVRL